MKRGNAKPVKTYGYEVADGELVIKPDEAEVVRMIFTEYLAGFGQTVIANKLNERGIPSPFGSVWSSGTVRGVRINPKACGNVLHQRSYVTDHITKNQVSNHGELPMYLFEDTHEGIISKEAFDAAQVELTRRGRIGGLYESAGLVFRKKIYCSKCGRRFCHSSNGRGAFKYRAWICGGRDKRTGVNCTMLVIPEPTLMTVAAGVLGLDAFDGEVFSEKVERIIACDNRRLTFILKDGSEVNAPWQKRKSIPYSKIGFEKRKGRNICYSIIGKGNGKVGERRRRKEAEREAHCTGNPSEEA